MKAEGPNSPADVFLTVDAGRIWLADREGLLQPVDSDVLEERVPGVAAPSRRPLVRPVAARPRDLLRQGPRAEPAADLRGAGRSRVRGAGLHPLGDQRLQPVADELDHRASGRGGAPRAGPRGCESNLARAPEGGDTDQLKGLVSGACDIAVANTYYFARAKASTVEGLSEGVEGIGWVMPNQDTTGTHVNVAAAGVAANAPNRDNAVAFLEYMTTPEAQAFFADQNHEFPVVEGVAVGPVAAEYGDFKRDELNLTALGVNQPKAQAIFNEVGFP